MKKEFGAVSQTYLTRSLVPSASKQLKKGAIKFMFTLVNKGTCLSVLLLFYFKKKKDTEDSTCEKATTWPLATESDAISRFHVNESNS